MIGITNASNAGLSEYTWQQGVATEQVPIYSEDWEYVENIGWQQTKIFTSGNLVGLTDQSYPIISLDPTILTPENTKDIEKAYNCVTRVETGTSRLILTCCLKRPLEDFTLLVKGIY